MERVIDILSRLVDLLFEDAANKLNLRSLNSFLNELCICSAEQLNLMNKVKVLLNFNQLLENNYLFYSWMKTVVH